MQVRHLSYFVTLAKEQHFAKAAEICCISQPTLSAAIRKLEDDLDLRLVLRGRRYLGLTPEGKKVLEWAHQILVDCDSMRTDLAGLRGGRTGTLRLGVIPTAMPVVQPLTSKFRALHPAATVEIRAMPSVAIQGGLDRFELDAGLTYLENEPLERVRGVPLYRERYALMAKRQARFAGRASIGWREIAREPMCLLSEDMQNRRILDTLARRNGIDLRPGIVSNSFLGVYAHVCRGDCCAIVPHSFAHLFEHPAVVMLDLVEPFHDQAIGLVCSDRSPLPPMATAILHIACSLSLGDDPRAWS